MAFDVCPGGSGSAAGLLNEAFGTGRMIKGSAAGILNKAFGAGRIVPGRRIKGTAVVGLSAGRVGKGGVGAGSTVFSPLSSPRFGQSAGRTS